MESALTSIIAFSISIIISTKHIKNLAHTKTFNSIIFDLVKWSLWDFNYLIIWPTKLISLEYTLLTKTIWQKNQSKTIKCTRFTNFDQNSIHSIFKINVVTFQRNNFLEIYSIFKVLILLFYNILKNKDCFFY